MENNRIWIICHYATPLKYGYGARHFLLAEEFIRMGYEVTVFASTSNYQLNIKPSVNGIFTHENVNGVEVVWVRGIKYTNPAGIRRVLSWFIFSFFLLFYRSSNSSKPGIIIVSSLSLVSVLNGIVLKRRSPSSQFIFEIRDLWPQTLIDIGRYSKYNPLVLLLGWIEKRGYKNADHIVATMPRADLHIRKKFSGKFNFSCIPQGIDLNLLTNAQDISENELKQFFPDSGFIVGYAGALGLSNSLETLVAAARLLDKRGISDIHFIFLGDGNAKEQLVDLARDLKNLHFIPRISKAKVQNFLNHCSILYDSVKSVPIYEYGLSRNKWMDYMMSGKPLVVSYSGYVSLINEADCGTVVPAGDHEALAEAILDYYKMDKDELVQIGNRGREYVLQNRTFNKLAAKYRKIFWY